MDVAAHGGDKGYCQGKSLWNGGGIPETNCRLAATTFTPKDIWQKQDGAAEEQVRCLKPGLAVLQWHYLGVGEWDHDLNL